ncbi:uncharacterized protein [Triticum aestivum]|uniref:uncharacterized protein n=1 Tax=Triticum aestivum TaxID=4565 RepID=UPI001D00A251|nr:uncharacterized protein LOC123184286 [Triticum aestivum]
MAEEEQSKAEPSLVSADTSRPHLPRRRFPTTAGEGTDKLAMAAATDAARGFLKAAAGEGTDKARLYSRQPARAVKYHCNFDLYQSPVANTGATHPTTVTVAAMLCLNMTYK